MCPTADRTCAEEMENGWQTVGMRRVWVGDVGELRELGGLPIEVHGSAPCIAEAQCANGVVSVSVGFGFSSGGIYDMSMCGLSGEWELELQNVRIKCPGMRSYNSVRVSSDGIRTSLSIELPMDSCGV